MKQCALTVFLLVVLAINFGCEKDELPKPFTGEASANTIQVSMGSDYANQLFFELSSATIVSQNNREIWDLGFSCVADSRHIVLNSSKYMALSITTEIDLIAVSSSTPVEWIYDDPSGSEDSSAFLNWELERVYILDRGVSILGQQIGKMKFRITTIDESGYTIQWASSLNSQTIETAFIPRNDDYNFAFFSFTSNQTVSVEPPKQEWDLCFSSYTYVYDDGTPYLVTGVLSNRNLTRVIESELSFDDIDFTYAETVVYTTDIDIIGYDWKFYDFDLATYVIQYDKVYVIKSVEGLYYKLRFLDFYDQSGNKGAPSFELQEIVP
ncbi:MAG: HmuY family protein [Bacteroidota bacterium]